MCVCVCMYLFSSIHNESKPIPYFGVHLHTEEKQAHKQTNKQTHTHVLLLHVSILVYFHPTFDQSLQFKTPKCNIFVTFFVRHFVLSSKCGVAPNFQYIASDTFGIESASLGTCTVQRNIQKQLKVESSLATYVAIVRYLL